MTLGCAAATQARAESWFAFEAGIGATFYTESNGKWLQDGAIDNHVVSSAPALSIGLTGPLLERQQWGIDWHADLVYVGLLRLQNGS